MADNYTQSSSLIPIPDTQREAAAAIIRRIETELEEDPDEQYCEFNAEMDDTGVWVYHDENINLNHLEKLVRALVEELDLEGAHVCSWAYTCSKRRIGEFGGGAFAIRKGYSTVWVDAAEEAERLLAEIVRKHAVLI